MIVFHHWQAMRPENGSEYILLLLENELLKSISHINPIDLYIGQRYKEDQKNVFHKSRRCTTKL